MCPGRTHPWRVGLHACCRLSRGKASAALALDPNLVEARYNRACWRVATGDLEGAARALARMEAVSASIDLCA